MSETSQTTPRKDPFSLHCIRALFLLCIISFGPYILLKPDDEERKRNSPEKQAAPATIQHAAFGEKAKPDDDEKADTGGSIATHEAQ